MASQSSELGDGIEAYVTGWQDISRAVDAGASWSGHEANNAYLNLGDGRFVEVASILGLDELDDGRGVVRVDWDGDGDEDLIYRARTAPGLRFYENPLGRRGITVELVGRGLNTSAVGARLNWKTDIRSQVQEVRAGEGYLTQPSLRRTFGLADGERLPTLTVRWPDGASEDFGFAGTGTFRLIQGAGVAEALPAARELAQLEEGALPVVSPPQRVVLRTALPLAPELQELLVGEDLGRPVLIEAWSRTCQPCREELVELVAAREQLEGIGLSVRALSIDPLEEGEGATTSLREALGLAPEDPSIRLFPPARGITEALESLLGNILDKEVPLGLPTSLLLDPAGAIQVVYLGKVDPQLILSDARLWALSRPLGAFRSDRAGRWFFEAPRNWADLGRVLRERGFPSAAAHYTER